MAAAVLVAKETFVATYQGAPHVIHKGVTRVRAGHPIAKEYADFFEPVTVHFDVDDAPVEQATAAPGEARQTQRRRKPAAGDDA